MIQLDGHSTITAGFIIRFLARRIFSPHIFSPRRWAVFVKRVMGTDNSKHKNTVDDMDFFEMPDRNTLASDLSHLIARNVRLFYVYSDGANTYYNHRGQLRRGLASVDFGEALTECLIPSANHMFSGLSERTILFEHVLTWLAEGWPLQDNETPHV
ncbi:MAG: hypothetical protein L0H73_08260 [Nitrococcus sp.]|nr:hypothetical protein [Nitrococcus sp.]